MNSISRILFVLIFASFNLISAQKKKKIDTVYVYEKVTVYDTIYFQKAIPLRFADISLPKISVGKLIFKNPAKPKTQNAIKKEKAWQYSVEAGFGLKENIWSKSISGKNQFGENVGIWVSRKLGKSKFSLQAQANLYYWNSTFDLDANKKETALDGFYFTNDDQPLLFQRFNDQHLEATFQIKALYEWKKFKPFLGFLLNHNFYKMTFLVPENGVLSKEDDFTSSQINAGFSVGLQYQIMKKLNLFLDYQQYHFKNIFLKNSDFDFDMFKTNNNFVERKINLGISYAISKR